MIETLKAALWTARERLDEQGIGSAALDAEVLLSHITGLERAALYMEWDRLLRDDEAAQFNDLIRRRLSGEPVAYITGHKEFMGLDFFISRSVLIPRPETELLVENALKVLPSSPAVIDVGTGSGIIAVSLAFYNREALVHAVDYCNDALEVARRNAVKHLVSDRVLLYQGDLLQPLKGCLAAGRADLIAANLPYIAECDLSGLPGEVRMFEPQLALNGGKDGLEHYRRLIPQAESFLKQGGFLLMEIGCEHGQAAAALFDAQVWEAKVLQDLAGHDRLVVARLRREIAR